MQILLFVTMLLMIMTLATTTHFNLFLLSSGVRHEYTRYIQQEFFDYYNQRQKSKYVGASDSKKSRSPSQKKDKAEPEKPEPPKTKSVTRINIQPLFAGNKPASPAAESYAANVKTLLIRFIEISYSNEPPFKEAFAHMSVEAFVNQMLEGGKHPICGQPIRAKTDLSGLPFATRDTRELFYWMMIGGGLEKRYPALLDYFAWDPSPAPINVYAAPELLIRALYRDNPLQVELLLKERKELNRTLNETKPPATPETRQEKAKTWGALFNMEILTGFPESFLDFSISENAPGEG